MSIVAEPKKTRAPRKRNPATPRPKNPLAIVLESGLTAAELGITELLPRGNREIASHLGITESTVKVHLRNAMKKLGCRNRAELALSLRRLTGGDQPTKKTVAREIRKITVHVPGHSLEIELQSRHPIRGKILITIG